MNNKEAIEYGKRWDRAIESRGDTLFSESRQFLNLAIKALEARPQGEWTNKHFEHADCSLCGRTNDYHGDFCKYCGSDNRGTKE